MNNLGTFFPETVCSSQRFSMEVKIVARFRMLLKFLFEKSQSPYKAAKMPKCQNERMVIKDQKVKRPKGHKAKRPKGQKAKRPKGHKAKRPKGQKAKRPKDHKAKRPKGQKAKRPKRSKLIIECTPRMPPYSLRVLIDFSSISI